MDGKEIQRNCEEVFRKEKTLMENIIDFILGGSADFTPETLIRYMIFVMVLSCIGSIVSNIFDVGRQ